MLHFIFNYFLYLFRKLSLIFLFLKDILSLKFLFIFKKKLIIAI